ncbi:GNAT family N-acetyltransferase [Agrobacterium sp. NPDC090273]|uniref:GNAT family N-acetyltransferase n=1 Tax=Agrobacterium sp. NPDC090273 TaxID=3363919 RepID=UPI00383B0807
MELRLLKAHDVDGWKAYHAICRHVLFELRGQENYDPTHPDEHREGHFPLLFSLDGTPVGTVRLDLDDAQAGVGIVRLVAVLPEYQRRGVGSAMMQRLQSFAATKGAQRLDVHAARNAVPFYEKLGWHVIDPSPDSPLMTKPIG